MSGKNINFDYKIMKKVIFTKTKKRFRQMILTLIKY